MRGGLLALTLAPLLIAATASDQVNELAAKQFASSVVMGAPLAPELLAEALTGETVAALSQLKGCSVSDVDRAKVDLYGVQWKCPKDMMPPPQWTAVLLTIADGKVSKVGLAKVSTQLVRAPIGTTQ